jgi:hypothetical protein
VQFWIKDRENRYLHANRTLLLNYALDDLAQIVGKTDYAFSPPFLADQFWFQSHFSHEFHRQLGRTPREYRAHYGR